MSQVSEINLIKRHLKRERKRERLSNKIKERERESSNREEREGERTSDDGGALEEGVLKRLGRRDAQLGIVLEDAEDEVLELGVVLERVAGLVEATRLRTADLGAEYVAEEARAGRPVAFALSNAPDLPRAVRKAVEEALGLGALLEHVERRHAEHFDDLVHLIELVVAVEERLARVHLDEYAAETPHVDGHVVREAEQNFR